ncbi:MAG TPA: coniferyl aldehyde dehydrogenase [Polyangiaceae bacterium]|nr:coniferyl aldehyde dehydrogenase [Polyangiaceae bacterium]
MDAATPAPAASSRHPSAILSDLKEAARKRVPTYEERIDALDRLQAALVARKDAIVRAVAADFGHRSKHETLMGDILPVLGAIQHTKTHLRDWMEPEDRETDWVHFPSTSKVIHQPLGVVGIIAPWNYPLQLTLSPLVGAVAAGNRSMIKPSELAPRSADVLRDVVGDAFAADWVAVVTGGQEVAETFAALPFDHLIFTGSTRVGKLVMRAASDNLVPVTLELGGKSPAIVGRDYDAGTAASRIMCGKTFNAGQTCIAPDYALVPTDARGSFVEGCRAAVTRMYPTLAGNPDYSGIASDAHYERLRALVDDARSQGAEVVELDPANEKPGADATARKIAPTLLLGVTDSMHCMQDEIFGPLLPIVTYAGIDQAIAHVNARPRPLALYYFGHSEAETNRVLTETLSGGVTINDTLLHIMQNDLPYGGVGASGMGKYHSREGFLALSHQKSVFRQSWIRARGLLVPPYRATADRLLRFLLGA